jgi:hypothetical protein
MTQAIQIPSMPAIIPVASFIDPAVVAEFNSLEDVPFPLQALETVMVFIDNNGNQFHLNGPQAGREGVVFYENLQGEHHLFFEQVVIEGSYLDGGIITRQNYLMRKINFRVFIGAPGMNNITYRMSEERWWAGQDEVNGGWFGVFTRYSGWRWVQVFPAKTVDTTQTRDPVAYNNNCAIWDVDWLSPIPNYAKPAVVSQPWTAANAGPADANGFFHGVIAIPNRADMKSHVIYGITGANSGTCLVQDNNSSTMVQLPPILPTDGDVTCNTDPTKQPLVAAFDSTVDSITSASGLLNFFLQGGTTPALNNLWLRGWIEFQNNIPPFTITNLHVMHNNPGAVITAQLPQRFKRSR